MISTTAVPVPTTSAPSTRRAVARWMISFLGFPLGGLAAWVLTGPVIDATSAVTGGLLTGAVLGAVQAWALRADRRHVLTWVIATAVGMAVGLTAGASLVGFSTTLTDLAIQGAATGAAVGLAQTLVLWRRTGPLALAWPGYLAAAWAAGWTVTTLAGIGVEEQFTVFGASGALVVALLTSVLPLVMRTRPRSNQQGHTSRVSA
jgi:hypothetical protein